jgi:uncharacterized protein YjbJ (UPF0337 family)
VLTLGLGPCSRSVGPPTVIKRAKERYERFFGGRGVPVRRSTRKGTVVSTSDKAKNKVQETKGKVKETAGQAVGNERLEAEGAADQTAGDVKQAGEKVKDAAKSLKP